MVRDSLTRLFRRGRRPGEVRNIMGQGALYAVTGAFGYSGQYITRRLLERGKRVLTLTNALHRPNPFGEQVRAVPFNFEHPDQLTEALRGVEVLYNTYWVRFNTRKFSHAMAVRNTQRLFAAARVAGVRRVVHISITNPSEDSPFEYFRSKARLEQELVATGLSHAILRPAVLFGGGDILINNIAWTLRQLPVIGYFGDGRYRLRPIHVDDLARLAVAQGEGTENCIVNAVGPETFTYRGLLEMLCQVLGKRRILVPVPAWVGYMFCRGMGLLVGDIILTWDELRALMSDLLYVEAPAAGATSLTAWVREHAEELGRRYASELARRQPLSGASELPGA